MMSGKAVNRGEGDGMQVPCAPHVKGANRSNNNSNNFYLPFDWLNNNTKIDWYKY